MLSSASFQLLEKGQAFMASALKTGKTTIKNKVYLDVFSTAAERLENSHISFVRLVQFKSYLCILPETTPAIKLSAS